MSQPENQQVETSADQAADLAALQAAANEQTQAKEAAQAAGQPPAPDLATELSGLVTVAVKMLTPALPSLAEIYTPETIGTASQAIAAVCYKHNWMQGGLLGEWGEEIAAAVVLVPLAIATSQGIKSDIARAKAKVEDKAAPTGGQETLAGPEQKAVIIGAPVVEA